MQKRLARGRVELAISVQLRSAAVPIVELNAEFATALSAALDRARERGLVSGSLTPGDLLRLPQALTVRDRPVEVDPAVEAQLAASVEAAVEQALADLDAMRTSRRRASLCRPRWAASDARQSCVAAGGGSRCGRGALETRLKERVREISFEVPVDQALIAQEIVRAAALRHQRRSDAVPRAPRTLGSAAGQFRAVRTKARFPAPGNESRDQHDRRKADGLHVSELIITAKAELEKMREQVQNVE